MSEQRYPVHVAEDFLRANLPANAKDIKARARAAGIASSTLWRAHQEVTGAEIAISSPVKARR
jgi:hypothetical protein